MSISTNNIQANQIQAHKIIIDDPVEDKDAVNKKYVSSNFVKKEIQFDDIPTEILSGTNFSLSNMAEDLSYLEWKIYSNPVIQDLIFGYENNFNTSNVLGEINIMSITLTNICRNFVNDPDRVCFNPECFYKRLTLITSTGDVIVDVSTYKDGTNDDVAVNRKLNLDTNICYIKVKDKSFELLPNTSDSSISNFSGVDISNLSSKGIYKVLPVYAYTNPDLNEDGKYRLFTEEELSNKNPMPSNKSPVSYEMISENVATEEIFDAMKNVWGWSSKVNTAISYLPGYYIAHNSKLPISDEYNVIVRLSYQIYS
jgi:hypothetical protein